MPALGELRQRTRADSGQCRPDLASVCGIETLPLGDQCVGSGGSVACGPGTTLSGNDCLPDLSGVCGAGTAASGGLCVAAASACGAGLVFGNGQCISPAPLATVASFSAQNLSAAFWTGPGGNFFNSEPVYESRIVVTDLPNSGAVGWVMGLGQLAGQGSAMHFRAELNFNGVGHVLEPGATMTMPIVSTFTAGACTNIAPGDLPETRFSALTETGLYAWALGTPTLVACGAGGSVLIERTSADPNNVRLTFNVQFNDGTAWLGRTFTAPYLESL
jgi:hypothetical protein